MKRHRMKRGSAKAHKGRMKRVYPYAVDVNKVGKYSLLTGSGGGYLWDDVLEYRVWVHPGGDDYARVFASYESAKRFSENTLGAEKPLALVRQKMGHWVSVDDKGVRVGDKERITEWQVEWLDSKHRYSPSALRSALVKARKEFK